jgi:hypothetical protein
LWGGGFWGGGGVWGRVVGRISGISIQVRSGHDEDAFQSVNDLGRG